MNTVAVLVARMSSDRLPGKPMLDLGGKSSLERHVERIRKVKGINKIYIATSKDKNNSILFQEAERLGIDIYAGSEENIVERFVSIGRKVSADVLIRIGCDKPLFSYELLQKNIDEYNGQDYVYFKQGITVGLTHELLSLSALLEVHKHYHGTAIAQYIRQQPHKFIIQPIAADSVFKRPEYRLALDTLQDYELLKILFEEFKSKHPVSAREVLRFLDDNPQVTLINKDFKEKNVNIYCWDLEKKPVFTIMMDDKGKYSIFDRMGKAIEYRDFLQCVSDKKKWRLGQNNE